MALSEEIKKVVVEFRDASEGLKKAARILVYAACGLLACVIILSGVVYFGGTFFNNKINDLSNGDTPAAIASRQRTAKLMFQTCAKDLDTIEEDKREDFMKSCEGYETLTRAYETNDVKPPKG